MDLVVAGTEAAVLMVESEAKQLSEEVMLGGVVFGHEQGNIAIDAIHELVRDAGKPAWDWQRAGQGRGVHRQGRRARRGSRCATPTRSARKQARTQATPRRLRPPPMAALHKRRRRPSTRSRSTTCCSTSKPSIVRSQILAGEPRIDGRDTRTVRPIEIRTGVLPRAHGSALFTRGETQALVAATLGTERDAQRIDALAGEYSEHFMLHYNMPPFATGETGRVGTPEAARDRPRPPGQARAGRGAADAGRLPVLDARRLGDHRVERLVVDGLGVRRLPRADGRRRAAEGARRRHRDGPDQGRQPLRRADRHPRRRGSPRRHGLQGRRHDRRRDRAADGHQDPGHHQGDHAGRAGAGQGSAPAHPRQDGRGDGRRQAPRSRSSRRACTR